MMDAKHLTQSMRGKWYGRYGCAPCPVCQHEGRKAQKALTLADGTGGKLLLDCKKTSCDYRDIATAAGITQGTYTPPDPAIFAQRAAEQRKANAKRAQQAQRVWMRAQPVAGTVAEGYLRGRGITCPLPDTLRFDPQCWHATAKTFPAMVALVEGGAGFAVHRTYLCCDGMGKADIDPPKAMLGAVTGGAVRLTDRLGPLVVAEGDRDRAKPCLWPPADACDRLGSAFNVWHSWAAFTPYGFTSDHCPRRRCTGPRSRKRFG